MAGTLDPQVADLVDAAFAKSWPFVKTDPELAHDDPQEMRTRLADRLRRLAQNGEWDGCPGQARDEEVRPCNGPGFKRRFVRAAAGQWRR